MKTLAMIIIITQLLLGNSTVECGYQPYNPNINYKYKYHNIYSRTDLIKKIYYQKKIIQDLKSENEFLHEKLRERSFYRYNKNKGQLYGY